jgi:steroid delta-isomerase-like uncharacterized protein
MPKNRIVVQRFIEEVINQGNLALAGELVWDDVVEQAPFPGQAPGLQGLQEVLRELRAAFPDLYFTVEEQIGEDGKVVTRFDWTGTHRGEFLGIPATGRPVKVWGVMIQRVVDGKIKESRIIMDNLGLMAQLGFHPSSDRESGRVLAREL